MQSVIRLDLAPLGSGAAVVERLAAAFDEAGHGLYLVGGMVRDLILDQVSPTDDLDLTTDAEPDAIKTLLEPVAGVLWTQGERFGTIGASVEGRTVEITTHRAELYRDDSRQPIVTFGSSIEDDLFRRDFTINAMAVALPSYELFDPYHGRMHLAEHRLVTPGSPVESFVDDPLRILRAARFTARFGLRPEPDLVRAATDLAPRIEIVSAERISDELERLLALPDPGPGLDLLVTTGLLGRLVPEYLERPDAVAAGVAVAAAVPASLSRRAGLLHPLGPEGAGKALRRLRYSNQAVDDTTTVLFGLPLVADPVVSAEHVRRTVARIGLSRLTDTVTLARALEASGHPSPAGFEAELFRLRAGEDLTDLGPPLSGQQVMDHLDLGPGPVVGQALTMLRNHRLASGPFDAAGAYRLLDRWWRARSAPH
ncbi:MAG: CCA tRNA nucleotidyltransferase [Acidimicrobiales bacterium]